ncbi:MAG: type II secretion system F family protein [Patescibacteria group bacterium]|jgi:type IV pilus assembly protein PilC
MPIYHYSAKNEDGEVEKGQVKLPNEEALRTHLIGKNLALVSVESIEEEKKKSGFDAWLTKHTTRISVVQKIFFTQNLEVMLRTGFSLSEALKTLALQVSNKTFKKIIGELQSDVEKGQTLADAMRKHQNIFSELFINMIAVGEASGKLDEVLKRLTLQLKKDHALITKVKGALTYPIIVIVAMIGIGIGMIVFVLPQITSLFEGKADLPLPTKILLGLSDFTRENGILLGIGVVILIGLFIMGLRTPSGHALWDRLVLRLPVAGNIIKKVNIAKFTRTFSSLLETDIPIVQVMEIISRTLSNSQYQNALLAAAERLKKGERLTDSLSGYDRLFPPLVTQMFSVGEQSGTLNDVSSEIATFYEEEVDNTMANLSTIIEPVLMLFLGVGVAALAIAVIMPIYSLSDTI